MTRPVFGVDRVPEPWQPVWEDGSLLTTEELAEQRRHEEMAQAFADAMGFPAGSCGGIVEPAPRGDA